MDSLEGWSQPCSQAVREILYDERLSNEQRRAEISRVKQRFANREEYVSWLALRSPRLGTERSV